MSVTPTNRDGQQLTGPGEFVTQSVHQLLPSFVGRDAVGNHTMAVRDVLRGMGLDSEIFAANIARGMRRHCRHADELPAEADVLIYQMSIGSHLADVWARHRSKRVVNYHNITPWHLVGRWDGTLANEIITGRDQLYAYASECDHAIAVSEFNRHELVRAGYSSTETVPVVFDPVVDHSNSRWPASLGRWAEVAGDLVGRTRRRAAANVLFVGRLLPHKNQHQLVAMLKVLRDDLGIDAHLHLVGDGLVAYRHGVTVAIHTGQLTQHVTMHGAVSAAKLAALYANCDVFCCLSDHEGFCIPILEAMSAGLPVVAYGRSAVTETVADAGLLLSDRHPVVAATAVQEVLTDSALRSQMATAGRRRADAFSRANTEERLEQSMRALLEAA